jgi:NAD-dependent dihydropyrimidine dehydrogenase PreA subunit
MSLVHALTGEDSRFRRWTLYLFARYVEMPLLALGYHLLRGRFRRLGSLRLVRALLGWMVAAPMGYLGDTARPVPAADLLHLIDDMEDPMAVGPCRCRTAHRGCDHPLETDIVIRTGVEAWTRAFPHEYRPIDREEAKAIVAACSRQGMWPMVFVHCPAHAATAPHSHQNEYVICNCCTCGCVPYILNRDLGQRVYPLLPGDYVAETDLSRCVGHGDCVAACPFGVRAIEDGRARLVEACFGCGVCVATCPEGAITMQPLS